MHITAKQEIKNTTLEFFNATMEYLDCGSTLLYGFELFVACLCLELLLATMAE
jgi:hypothetical protein